MPPTNGKAKKPNVPGKANVRKKVAVAAKAIKQTVPKPLRSQFQSLASPLTRQDDAILAYLSTVADPFIDNPSGVPLILGSGGVTTIKAEVERTFTVQAGTTGFGFLSVNADAWIGYEDGVTGTGYAYATYNGGVAGYDIWYTGSTYASSAIPAYSATTATTGLLAGTMPLVDQSWNNSTQMRMVAMGLHCWSDDSAFTAKGDVYVLSTSEPFGDPAHGAITGCTEAVFTNTNKEIMARSSVPLSGWVSGNILSTSAVPSTAAAFDFHIPVASGNTSFGFPQIAVVMTGAAAGQTLKVKVSKVFEFEKNNDNRVGDLPEPTVAAPADRVSEGLRQIHAKGPHHGPAPVGANGIHSGNGLHAFVNEVKNSNPTKLLSLSNEMGRPSSGWGETARQVLSFAAKKAVNFLPTWAGKAAAALASSFLG